MTRSLDALIERQILKAHAEGQLKNLSGEGKPLPDRPVIENASTAVGHSIMAGAGVRPRQFVLKEQLDAAREELRAATNPDQKKELMAKMAKLELAYNVEREAYSKFMK